MKPTLKFPDWPRKRVVLEATISWNLRHSREEYCDPETSAWGFVCNARLISELVGGDEELDSRSASVIGEVIDLCCRSKMQSPSGSGRDAFIEALELVDQKDWLFTIRKLGDDFQLQAKFGQEITAARLPKSVTCISESSAKLN